jgi:hypothetical protein
MIRRIYWVSLLFFISIAACNSSRINGSPEEKSIQEKIRKYRKNPADSGLQKEIEDLYIIAGNQHVERVKAILSIADFSRFDRLLDEYNNAQKINDLIRLSPAANFINTKNYFIEIESVKADAAAYLYEEGIRNMQYSDRAYLKKAWRNFSRIKNYQSGFRDSDLKIKEVYDLATVNVVISPLQYHQPYRNISSSGFLLSQLPEELAMAIGSPRYSGIPARFFTDKNTTEPLQQYWELDLSWEPYQVRPSGVSKHMKNVSQQIKKGVDSLGHQLYETVNAVIHIERKNYTMSGGIKYQLIDGQSEKLLSNGAVSATFTRHFERAKYTGDSRALRTEDWNLINNSKFNYQNDIEEELYKRIYPELVVRIKNEVDW